MITIITCTNCKQSGRLPVVFSVTIRDNRCDCCHKSDPIKWTFYFCDLHCHSEWLVNNDIKRAGVKCQDCITGYDPEPSGWAFGFESNGLCKTCNGNKRVSI